MGNQAYRDATKRFLLDRRNRYPRNKMPSFLAGGLGILDTGTMNRALLVKWWWKLQTAPQLQWNKLLRDLFYRRRRPLKEGGYFRPASSWWKDVLRLKDIYKWGAFYTLGNGSTIDFWEDRWLLGYDFGSRRYC
ncbi:hypothetical protein ACMD2_16963 [Ananas comosus]|uniref:Uncharacterized protein n=1 Tax=Ananas comosus TaxID=4615 RepID=A0A199V772_ANACO|nr:hypothetical protein ACMD2_16963 [Ananas comosus]